MGTTWTEPSTKPNKEYASDRPFIPFEVKFPKSAQFMAKYPIPTVTSYTPSQYYGPSTPTILNAPAPVPSEEVLRRKAVQYVRELYRSTPRKRAISNTDPDETSTSESEELTVGPRTSRIAPSAEGIAASSTPKIVSVQQVPVREAVPVSKYVSADRNRTFTVLRETDQASSSSIVPNSSTDNTDITRLTEHTVLLTSLLELYPRSKDQKGLRQDIAMLASVQHQRFEAWHKREADAARQKKKRIQTTLLRASSSSSAAHHGAASGRAASQPLDLGTETTVRDGEIRHLLSARAGLWQDGSGVGVADVYSA